MKGAWQSGVVLMVAAFLLAGCGPPIDTIPVQGKVTVAGAPVAGILVTFNPTEGRLATGTTDASGAFKLSTLSKEDGTVAGKHRVSFTMANVGSGGPAALPDYTKPGAKGSATTPFNEKYTKPDTSGIEVEVVAGQPNNFTWDLEK
jgi:hypothetical protein